MIANTPLPPMEGWGGGDGGRGVVLLLAEKLLWASAVAACIIRFRRVLENKFKQLNSNLVVCMIACMLPQRKHHFHVILKNIHVHQSLRTNSFRRRATVVLNSNMVD